MKKMLNENIKGLMSYQKALAYMQENLSEKALKAIEEAINAESKPLYILTKGKILAQQRKFKQAMETLDAIPDSCEEKKEAEVVSKRIRKLQKPYGEFLYKIKNSRALTNFSVLLILVVAAVFITLYFSERQKAILNSNLNNIYQETEKISEQVTVLNTLLENQDLVEKDDLEKHKLLILDSLNVRFEVLDENLDIHRKSIYQDLNLLRSNLDTLKNQFELLKKDLDVQNKTVYQDIIHVKIKIDTLNSKIEKRMQVEYK